MTIRKYFVFSDEYIKTRRRNNHKVNVYRVRKNKLSFVCEFHYTSASTPGPEAEVLQELIRIGEIPKKWFNSSRCEWRSAGYYAGPVCDVYSIKELY